MTKTEALRIFHTQTELARALGVTKQAISQWPEELDQARADRVLGAAVRLKKLPDEASRSENETPQEAA